VPRDMTELQMWMAQPEGKSPSAAKAAG